jgi:hypothetical protein
MDGRQYGSPRRIGRRRLLAGAGAAVVVGAVGAFSLPRPVSAMELQRAKPAPLPIPGIWFLPGPDGSSTPIIGIPASGLDVEPSTITDFNGFTAFAVLTGQAEGSNGTTYNVEFDLRVMEGDYVAEDRSRQHGTFGFF